MRAAIGGGAVWEEVQQLNYDDHFTCAQRRSKPAVEVALLFRIFRHTLAMKDERRGLTPHTITEERGWGPGWDEAGHKASDWASGKGGEAGLAGDVGASLCLSTTVLLIPTSCFAFPSCPLLTPLPPCLVRFTAPLPRNTPLAVSLSNPSPSTLPFLPGSLQSSLMILGELDVIWSSCFVIRSTCTVIPHDRTIPQASRPPSILICLDSHTQTYSRRYTHFTQRLPQHRPRLRARAVQRNNVNWSRLQLVGEKVDSLSRRLQRGRDEVQPANNHMHRSLVLAHRVEDNVADPRVGAAGLSGYLVEATTTHAEKTTRPLPLTSTTT